MVSIATNRTPGPSDKNSVTMIDTRYMPKYNSAIVHMHIVLTRVTCSELDLVAADAAPVMESHQQ